MYGGEKEDILLGGDGDDHLYGNGGDDRLAGNTGDDHLYGGTGNHTYVFAKGYGYDTIVDASGLNSIRLVGLNIEDIEFGSSMISGSNQNFVIKIKETGETITVLRGADDYSLYANYQIQNIEFADGSILSFAEALKIGLHGVPMAMIKWKAYMVLLTTTLNGGKGNDKFYGGYW